MRPYYPSCITNCVDCGVGTIAIGEWYMVKEEIWEEAWAGRRKSWHGKVPGQEILCIGCLETRLGRTLMPSDFTDAPVNNPDKPNMSARLFDRLTKRKRGRPKGSKNKPKVATEAVGPRVLNKRRDVIPNGAVYCGRPSKWGNPFKIGRDGDRDTVCDRFEREILPTLDVSELRGKDLVCHCAPERCHCDAILRKANNDL
jgi:hypothetical protein